MLVSFYDWMVEGGLRPDNRPTGPGPARAVERPERPCDRKTIWRTVRRIGRRAGVGTPVDPHQLRHAFAGRVTRLAGLHASQALLGHASIQTTKGHLTKPSLDELTEAMARVTLHVGSDRPDPPL